MKSMDKGLTIPKWPKIPQMPQNLSAQFVCPSPKVWDCNEKKLHQVSVVRGQSHQGVSLFYFQFIKIIIGPSKIINNKNRSFDSILSKEKYFQKYLDYF